jgi:hypothetical protein
MSCALLDMPSVTAASLCPGCCVILDDDDALCEDCQMSDCLYCSKPVFPWMLSDNLACAGCEGGWS